MLIFLQKWTSCHRIKSTYVDQRERDLSFKCYATNSSKHFVCYELPLDMGFNIVVAVNGEYVNKTMGHLCKNGFNCHNPCKIVFMCIQTNKSMFLCDKSIDSVLVSCPY